MNRSLTALLLALLLALVGMAVVGGNVGAGASRNFLVSVTGTETGRPGVGTGVAGDCDATINPGTSPLQTALNNVPATLIGDYVICLRAGAYGSATTSHNLRNTGDDSAERLIIKSYPGETAQIRGHLNLSASNTFVTVRDLYFDGRFQNTASGTTNQGNPNMRPNMHVAGSDTLVTNNDFAGGNDLGAGPTGARPLNSRSTCVGYESSPVRSTFTMNWVHNCGVLAANSASGTPDAHGLYTSNAGNGGTVSDNHFWGNAEQGINAYGTSVGPHGVIFEDNILWDNGRNMSISGAASGNTVRNSLFTDPNIGNDRNIMGNSTGAPTDVIDDCLDSAIRATNVNTSGNVIVSDASMSFSGTPRSGNFSITTTSECRAKYGGTMYP